MSNSYNYWSLRCQKDIMFVYKRYLENVVEKFSSSNVSDLRFWERTLGTYSSLSASLQKGIDNTGSALILECIIAKAMVRLGTHSSLSASLQKGNDNTGSALILKCIIAKRQ